MFSLGKPEDCQEQLIDKIAEQYRIDRTKAKAKIITNEYISSQRYQQFPYCLEAVMAPKRISVSRETCIGEQVKLKFLGT